MTQISLPGYTELSQMLNQTELKLHASQVHGLVSGILTANTEAVAWKELVTGDKSKEDTREQLQMLYDSSARQLRDFLFEFQLLMPSEEESLPERAEALSLWCQGFLTGLEHAGVSLTDRNAGEVSEAIADLIEIAKMDYDEVVATEEDEAAYMELVEYVRMAVILIYQELHEQTTDKEPVHSSSHLH